MIKLCELYTPNKVLKPLLFMYVTWIVLKFRKCLFLPTKIKVFRPTIEIMCLKTLGTSTYIEASLLKCFLCVLERVKKEREWGRNMEREREGLGKSKNMNSLTDQS